MSMTASRNSFLRQGENQQSPYVTNREQQSPIKRYMRQNNNYLVAQQSSIQQNKQSRSPSGEFKNLREFERSLQKQRQTPPKNSDQMLSSKKKTPPPELKRQEKERERQTYAVTVKQPPIEPSYKEDEQNDDEAFTYKALETSLKGNNILERAKNLIVVEQPAKGTKSPRRRKVQPHQYNVSSSIQKLHKDHQKIDDTRRSQYIRQVICQDNKNMQPFKVNNPTSQYLNHRRIQSEADQRPLYERATQMVRQKNQAILQRQFLKEEEKRLRQQEEIRKFQQIRRQKYPEAHTKEKQEQFYNQLVQKEKEKNQAKQQQKLKHLKQITKQKPYVSKMSKELFNKIVKRDDLSTDFVDRNMEYKVLRDKQKEEFIRKHDAEFCPFAPKISLKSREYAQKYEEKKEYRQKLQEERIRQQKQKLQLELKGMKKTASQTPNKTNPSPYKVHPLVKHNRSSSAYLLRPKEKSPQKPVNNSSHKHSESRQSQIPIYNRLDRCKKRSTSCFNASCHQK